MIKINTSHILPDTPYLLDGTESAEILELPPDADPPLAPAGDITYHLSAVMAGADLIVTGEGKLDTQSLQGKVVSGIAAHARRAGVPLAVICGSSDLEESQASTLGLAHLMATSSLNGTEYALRHAEEAYLDTARKLFNEVAPSPE